MKEGTARGAAALGRVKLLRGTGGMGSTGETELDVSGTHEGHPAPVTEQSNGDLALDHGGTVKGKAGRTKINPI